MRILRALGVALFRPSTHQNWLWERKLTQSCWCLRWFLGLRADIWKIDSSDQNPFCRKRPLAIAAMNAELPPFKNGEHNSKSVSTIDRVITPLRRFHSPICVRSPSLAVGLGSEDPFTPQRNPSYARSRITFEPINGDEVVFLEAVTISASNENLLDSFIACCFYSQCHCVLLPEWILKRNQINSTFQRS